MDTNLSSENPQGEENPTKLPLYRCIKITKIKTKIGALVLEEISTQNGPQAWKLLKQFTLAYDISPKNNLLYIIAPYCSISHM